MNPWDIDPTLYAALWRFIRLWYRRRLTGRTALPPAAGGATGCRP